MKKFYFLLLFFIPTSIFAQPYFNSGARWLYGMWPNDTIDYILIEKTGETWIGGKFCDELRFTEYNPSQIPNTYVYYHYTYYSGDTINIYRSQNGTFGLLYDFSAIAGDTLSCIMCSDSYILDSVTQTFFNSVSLESQHYTFGPFHLINYEKIGNTGFFIPWHTENSPMSPGWHLRCYQDNTGLNYYDGSSNCSPLASVESHSSISISASSFGATFSCGAIKPGSEISVYDIFGNLVVSEIATQFTMCSVEFTGKAQAMYCITIRNGNQLLSEKFVLLTPR